jgi:hypothetical protein
MTHEASHLIKLTGPQMKLLTEHLQAGLESTQRRSVELRKRIEHLGSYRTKPSNMMQELESEVMVLSERYRDTRELLAHLGG